MVVGLLLQYIRYDILYIYTDKLTMASLQQCLHETITQKSYGKYT